ncbi:MAG TPA: hypothetical protein VGF82_13385 [Terracidiphilus sp.]
MQRPLALSSEDFRSLAHSLSDFTSNYLDRLPAMRSFPEGISGTAVEELFCGGIPLDGLGGSAFDLLPEIFENSRPACPRFFGYVFGSGDPSAHSASSHPPSCIRMQLLGAPVPRQMQSSAPSFAGSPPQSAVPGSTAA